MLNRFREGRRREPMPDVIDKGLAGQVIYHWPAVMDQIKVDGISTIPVGALVEIAIHSTEV